MTALPFLTDPDAVFAVLRDRAKGPRGLLPVAEHPLHPVAAALDPKRAADLAVSDACTTILARAKDRLAAADRRAFARFLSAYLRSDAAAPLTRALSARLLDDLRGGVAGVERGEPAYAGLARAIPELSIYGSRPAAGATYAPFQLALAAARWAFGASVAGPDGAADEDDATWRATLLALIDSVALVPVYAKRTDETLTPDAHLRRHDAEEGDEDRLRSLREVDRLVAASLAPGAA